MNEYERDRIARNQVAIAEAQARAEVYTRRPKTMAVAIYDLLNPNMELPIELPKGHRWKMITFDERFRWNDSPTDAWTRVERSVVRHGIPEKDVPLFVCRGSVQVSMVEGSESTVKISIHGPYVPSVWRQM